MIKPILATSAIAILAVATPLLAQTRTKTPKAPSTSDAGLPESMRIQERAERQYFNKAVAPNSTGTTTEAPGTASSPVEQKRIDPAAPSKNRLQIDPGQSARARQNPDTNAPQSNTGTSYNTIVRGAPSNSGTSGGVSGSSGTGMTTSPSTPGATSSSPSSGTSGTGGAASSGSSSGGGH
jgi:hypothetical protein